MAEQLQRSTSNRVWSGVCGGIAEYFVIDATVVRAFFVIATIFSGGLFLLVYIALLVLMPHPARDLGSDATPPAASAEASSDRPARRREAAGWLLLVLGVLLLLANLGAFRFVQWQYVWPLVLIAIGMLLILRRSRA